MARRLTLVITLVAFYIGVFAVPQASALTPGNVNITMDCDGFSGTAGVMFDRENHGDSVSESWRVVARDGSGTTIYSTATLTTTYTALPFGPVEIVAILDFFYGTAWQSAPQTNPITMTIYSVAGTDSSGAPVGEESYMLAQGSCADLTVTVPVAGCDVLVDIPSTAVVGLFVADANLYWAPGNLTDPLATITAGNTAWVLGKDASGGYYKILWVCKFYWVPVGTMAPNPDAVWNSTPLPAEVVK